ncbi:MAG: LarC family nickel insertion protein, partial [Vicinamibacteria bacterium]|nr:LarC family nickel insertion protein [Vicinamibacteria bacterium]
AWGWLPSMRITASGYGAGTRDVADRPNVLRLVVGEEGAASADSDEVLLLEAQVDDMPPQLCEVVMARLLEAGAVDAWFTAITMKKGRLGILISALAPAAAREAVEAAYFAETTTLGVRRTSWQRTLLARERVPVATAYGEVGVKVGRRAGRVLNAWPEFEECRRAAETHGVPVKEVQQAALTAWRARDER